MSRSDREVLEARGLLAARDCMLNRGRNSASNC